VEAIDLESDAESSNQDVSSDCNRGGDDGDDNDGDNDNDDNDGDDDDDNNVVTNSDGEEETIDDLLDAGGAKPKPREDIREWHELREQIKQDLELAEKKKETHGKITQLLILRNFAMLRIKGCGRIAASKDIACQWHEGKGAHFAHRVRVLACHYQLFEQLPAEKRGGDRGHLLFNDEQVQTASRAYLTSLAMGEVTPKKFQHALNEHIFPSLGIELTKGLSERTAQ
jgi:hypothetical protein